MEEAVKPVWKSKTVLVNFAVALVSALALVVPSLAPAKVWLDANGAVVLSVLGVVGVALRLITKDKVVLLD